MSPEDIRVSNPDEVKNWTQTVVSLIEAYEKTLSKDLRSLDEVCQLCEDAKQLVSGRYESLAVEEQQTLCQDTEGRASVQGEMDICLTVLAKLSHYSELIENLKRDASVAIVSVRSISEEAMGTKERVDSLMDFLSASR